MEVLSLCVYLFVFITKAVIPKYSENSTILLFKVQSRISPSDLFPDVVP